jgi:hypothetical protein
MNIQIAVFWHITPCGLLDGYHVSEESAASFSGKKNFFYHEDEGSRSLQYWQPPTSIHGVINQKATI